MEVNREEGKEKVEYGNTLEVRRMTIFMSPLK